MKKYLLLLLLTVVGTSFSNALFAQCDPDPQYTDLGVWPKVVPASCINEVYETTLTLVYPNDSCLSIVGPTCSTVSLTSATITSVAGLPAGLSYSCPDANCVYLPGAGESTASCFVVSGTPTVAGSSTVTVTVALASSFGALNTSYDFDITINDVGTGGCTITSIGGVSSHDELTLSPNPTNGLVHLNKTITSGIVKNAEGATVLTLENVDGFDMNLLSSGLYLLITEDQTLKIIKE